MIATRSPPWDCQGLDSALWIYVYWLIYGILIEETLIPSSFWQSRANQTTTLILSLLLHWPRSQTIKRKLQELLLIIIFYHLGRPAATAPTAQVVARQTAWCRVTLSIESILICDFFICFFLVNDKEISGALPLCVHFIKSHFLLPTSIFDW